MREVLLRPSMLLLLALMTRRDVEAVPDLLRSENLNTLDCAAPDTRFMFLRSRQPGNVFYPGDAVDVTLKVTSRGEEPARPGAVRHLCGHGLAEWEESAIPCSGTERPDEPAYPHSLLSASPC